MENVDPNSKYLPEHDWVRIEGDLVLLGVTYFAQKAICMGPATRAGCEAQCPSVNMPCTGCGGPCQEALEQGAAMLSALASLLGVNEEKNPDYVPQKLIDQIKDPLGTFYKYGMPFSILKRKVMKK